MTTSTAIDEQSPLAGEAWRDQLEATVREHVRDFIEELVEAELCQALGRGRYVRKPTSAEAPAKTEEQEGLGDEEPAAAAVPTLDDGVRGHRNGCRERTIMGTFGKLTVSVPRARLDQPNGKTAEWVDTTLPKYRRRTRQVDALIAGAYLSGTNTRHASRAGHDASGARWRACSRAPCRSRWSAAYGGRSRPTGTTGTSGTSRAKTSCA